MRRLFVDSFRWLVCAACVVAGACHGAVEQEEPSAVALGRITPRSVSDPDGWRLFDRSVSSGFIPDEKPLVVTFDRSERIRTLKINGPSPYRLRLIGASTFDEIDMSGLSAGWNVLEPKSIRDADRIELQFAPIAGPGPISEIEFWAPLQLVEPSPDPLANDVTSQFVATVSSGGPKKIAPGSCADFPVAISRSPSQFVHTRLAYEAEGILRPFVLRRSVNLRGEYGGRWLPTTDQSKRSFEEEIDPQLLQLGTNTVRLCSPDEAAETVTVRNVTIRAELDRGFRLPSVVTVGDDTRAVDALVDANPRTSSTIGAGERLVIQFGRLIAPDVVVLSTGADDVARLECLDHSGGSTSLDFRPSNTGLLVDGQASACAALGLTFDVATKLAELDVLGSGAAERVDWPSLVVTSRAERFGDVAWIGGFIARPTSMNGAVQLSVAANAIDERNGSFGALTKRPSGESGAWSVLVEGKFPDGTKSQRTILLDEDRSSDVRDADSHGVNRQVPAHVATNLSAEGDSAVVRALPDKLVQVRLDSATGVDVPAGAVAMPTNITARHLGSTILPKLNPGMINVTAPRGHGYEFLPHGQRFAKAVDVLVPFDPRLIPDGMTTDDVHTYFYNEKSGRWEPLDRVAVDRGQNVLHSTTHHFTIMIDAVLAVPKNPTPLSFDPTALTAIGAASPAAGIDLIEPPTANSTGDARLGLPIRVPPGRGAYTPSLAISYSSSGGNGWMGLGWDLPISRIEIDTRWGVPRYTDGEEPRYLLDGVEIVPAWTMVGPESEGPTCANGRRYRARIEGAFTHILRCGTNASNYFWLLHDREGTEYVYGSNPTDAENASLRSYRARPCGSGTCGEGIFRWYLRQVTDTHSNTTRFLYTVDNIGGAEPSREVYPLRIEYTSHPAKAAAYSIDFVLDDGTRPDKIVSGRAGFKTMTRRLLRRVRVNFQNEVVREYVLTYKEGQFAKTLLEHVRMYGLGGCAAGGNAFLSGACPGEYQENHFDYHEDQLGFASGVIGLEMNGDPTGAPQNTRLGQGNSMNVSASIGAAIQSDPTGPELAAVGASANASQRAEMVGIYDVNGDGLPDQLFFVKDNVSPPRVTALYNHFTSFDSGGPNLVNLQSMGRENSFTWAVDASAGIDNDGLGATLSAGYSSGTSRAQRFLSDLDGDGYLDFVDAVGPSLFSSACGLDRCFNPGDFSALARIDPSADPGLQEVDSDIDERSIPGAPVVQWVAPYSGTVHVEGLVSLMNSGTTDGVAVEVYHQDAMLAGFSLTSPVTPASISTDVNVTAGEALYLRVTTGANDGISGSTLADLVYAPLTFSYTTVCLDASCGTSIPAYAAQEPTRRSVFDFTIDEATSLNARPFVAPATGTVRIRGILGLLGPEAPVRLCLQQFAASAQSTDHGCNDPFSGATIRWSRNALNLEATDEPFDVQFAVDEGDTLVFRVESDFSINPASVRYFALDNTTPRIVYVDACIRDDVGCSPTTDPDELAALAPPSFGFSVEPVSSPEPVGTPMRPAVMPSTASSIRIDPFPNPFASNDASVAIRSDLQGTMAVFNCTASSCLPSSQFFNVQSNESIVVEMVSGVASFPSPPTVNVFINNVSPVQLPVILRKRSAPGRTGAPFVGGFRNFYVTFWNEHKPFAPTELLSAYEDMSALTADQQLAVFKTAIAPEPAFDPSYLTQPISPDLMWHWVAPSSAAFIARSYLHAARIGAVGPPLPGTLSAPDGGLFTDKYARLSTTKSLYVGLSAPLPNLGDLGLSLSGTVTGNWTKTTADVVDMTGDGIADVVDGHEIIQGTLSPGVPPPLGFEFTDDGFRYRKGFEYTVGLGGTAATPNISSGGRTRALDIQTPHGSGLVFSAAAGLAFGRNETTDQLIDINGDGLPDRVQRRQDSSGDHINVRYNLGNEFGAWETIDDMDPAMAGAQIDSFQLFEDSVPAVDLSSTSEALEHETTLTENSSKTINLIVTKFTKSSRKTSARITRQLADLNGDGLPDLLLKKQGENIQVQFNQGSNFGPMQPWPTPPWAIGTDLAPEFDDAFDPLLVAGNYLITGPDVLAGGGTVTSTSWSGEVVIRIPNTPLAIKLGGGLAKSVDSYDLALLDIDGDGDADHVLRRSQGINHRLQFKRNQLTGKVNLLEKVTGPLHGTIRLEYAHKGNTVELPSRRMVLSKVTVDDGVDLGAGFASPNTFYDIEYEDGFFNRNEKEFFGFAHVKTTYSDKVVDLSYDNQSFPLHGRLLNETFTATDGRVLRQHKLSYDVAPVTGPFGALIADPQCTAPANWHPLLARVGTTTCTPLLVLLRTDIETRSEDGLVAKKREIKDDDFDRFGNVLNSTDSGDDAIINDDIYITAAYQNDTSSWIIGRPTLLEVHAGNASGQLLRQRTGFYYPDGSVKEISVWTGSAFATTKFEYDAYGNAEHVESPPNETGQFQTYDVVYDATTETYPTHIIDAFGYTSSASQDLRFGVTTTETDTNGSQIVRTLDAFGRLWKVQGPYDTSTAPALEIAYYPTEQYPRAVTVTRASAPADYSGPIPGPITTVTLTDGLGRTIELRKTAVVDIAGSPTFGMSTSGVVERDIRGRVIKSYQPFFSTGASDTFVSPPATMLFTSTAYDELDRPTVVTNPDTTTETTTYDIGVSSAGELLFRSAFSSNSVFRPHETFTDYLGRVREYVEHPTTALSHATRYGYLPTGELAQIVDPDGNSTDIGYDTRGLQVSLDNADTGLIEQHYDLMGNRVDLIEPNHRADNTSVHYVYDRNRLSLVDYPNKVDVTYTYGKPGDADGRAGRVSSISDETGTEDRYYGALGEVRRLVKNVENPVFAAYDHRFVADSLGRQLRVQYPDGEVVTNTYDNAGQLQAVQGNGSNWTKTYADQIHYDVFGNRTHMRFGNGVETTWSYEPARVRLESVQTTLPSSQSSLPIQDLHFAYNAVNDPIQVNNTLPSLTGPGELPGPSSVTFTHDGTGQLKRALATADLDGAQTTTYDENFTYTPSHGLLTKQRDHLIVNGGIPQVPPATNFNYTYSYGVRPHLPTQVGNIVFTYDASGNPASKTTGSSSTITFEWDNDNRLIGVRDPDRSLLQTNSFDASGSRIVRTSDIAGVASTTVYASRLYEAELNESATAGVKHVFAGGLRVASVLGDMVSGLDPSLPTSSGESYYFHSDSLGSTSVLTAEDGTVHQSVEYFVDGEVWIDRAPTTVVNRYLFNGKPFDEETGLYDYGQRFLDPRTSLWGGIDPAFRDSPAIAVERPVALAVSGYAYNSPQALVDPDGAQPAVPSRVYNPDNSSPAAYQAWADRPGETWASTSPLLLPAAPTIIKYGRLILSRIHIGPYSLDDAITLLEENDPTYLPPPTMWEKALDRLPIGPSSVPPPSGGAPPGVPVKPADRASFGALKTQKRKFGETEPLDMDHQPSFAAVKAAKEAEYGRPLTPAETRQLRNEADAVASPRPIHRGTSPTFGGRNTPEQIRQDQADLAAAKARDRAVFDAAMGNRSTKSPPTDK